MRCPKHTLFLVVIILFFASSVVVIATPPRQSNETDPLAQEVLSATMADLGLTPPDTKIEDWGCSYGDMCLIRMDHLSNIESENFTVFVRIWNSEEAAYASLFDALGPKLKQPLTFHGYVAFSEDDSYGDTFANFQVNRLTVYVSAGWDAEKDATEYLEVFYRNAVAHGLIADEATSTTATATMPPNSTPTVVSGEAITLKVYASNYGETIKTIDNRANATSVNISGIVTDFNTGTAISGATIEIISGATSASTQSTADGHYSLTALVPDGLENGVSANADFALSPQSNLTIKVFPAQTELIADGIDTSNVTIQVKDSQGNPLKNRPLNLTVNAEVGPGIIQPAQATTDDEGIIHALYTAFRLNPSSDIRNSRYEVSISAQDDTTGLVGSASIFVAQYQMDIVFGEYIPACLRCDFPSKFTIALHDYWGKPIANAPLSLKIMGGNSDGTLLSASNANEEQQEISLTTDNNGFATGYYKWQGSVDATDVARRIAIIDATTNAQAIKTVKIQGLDIAIAKIKEAGFTGVTGQQAFLKIYFKDRAHPNLSLDRFNIDEPNKLAVHVSIRQYHSDGVKTDASFEDIAGWGEDETGTFVKMYTTPHMPYIIPLNDGTSWYEIRIDPIIDGDIYLPDLFRANNDTIIALTTGTPENWLHLWLKDGVLTPHNWAGVVFKCVARFLPGLGNAITAIDTLNQTYNQDILGLSQSTAQVLTDNLEKQIAKESPQWLKRIGATKAAALNNVVSCLQDTYGVYKTNDTATQKTSDEDTTCAKLPNRLAPSYLIPMPDKVNRQSFQRSIDQFVNGMLMDTPTQRALLVYGLPAQNVVLRDAQGQRVDTDGDAKNNVVVYILPAENNYTLQITADTPFDVGVYQSGDTAETRKTYRYSVQPENQISALIAIGNDSDNILNLDKNTDGQLDDTLSPTTLIYDVVRPTIFDTRVTQDSVIFGNMINIQSTFADNPNGSGIDINTAFVWIDGEKITTPAEITPESLTLKIGDILPGKHQLQIEVSDKDGNKTITTQQFLLIGNLQTLWTHPILLIAGLGAIAFFLLLLLLLIILMRRKQSKSRIASPARAQGATQDAQGRWWYRDPKSKQVYFWNGHAWQAHRRQSLPKRIPPQKNSGCGSYLLVLIMTGILGAVIFGSAFLVQQGLIDGLNLPQIEILDTQDLFIAIGVSLFLVVIGLLIFNGGLKAIGHRRASVDFGDEDYSDIREVRGCRAVIHGIGQSFFGLIFLGIGLTLMALLVFQQLLPWLGF